MSAPHSSSSSLRPSKKLVIPKVWKRPHSTIYGKNVEFGNALYSDKIGELNSRKFNSELPYSVRNSGGNSQPPIHHYPTGGYSEGYLSNLLLVPPNDKRFGNSSLGDRNLRSLDYAGLLDITNPNRLSGRRARRREALSNSGRNNSSSSGGGGSNRIDFYDQYLDNFNKECHRMNANSLLANEPILRRKVFDNFLDFDNDLGLFMPNYDDHLKMNPANDGRSLIGKHTLDNNNETSVPLTLLATTTIPTPITKTQNTAPTTNLLPKHECQLSGSPYGQSQDGRKLSLSSINPHLYRPSMASRSTTAHASDGEEFEFQDKSSPFYTDR